MTILKIGNIELQNNLILAPMAGVTDLPYRKICKEHGCGLVCTEMVSAKAILYGNKNTIKLLEIDEDERPVSLQLFGANPDIIAEMAAKVSEENIDIIDLNMGCPVPKVVNNGEGSALMKNPKLVEEILTKLVRASKKPVTVKFRKGFDDNLINAVEIAKIAEASGVAAVAVHGRTREQYYSGKADWNIIKQVKENIKIPVIGNGDVFTPEAAKNLIEFTGCDGIMVARGAQGNPWIFSRTIKYLETGILMPEPTLHEIYQTMLTHAKMLVEYKGEYTGVREMRKHASWYTKGLYNMAKFRKEINEAENLDQLLELFRKNFE
ncbi:MAG: tRNA-U20-dihydrouridine synthase [Clostridiales bacterium]|jgi:nifR3 family TIM-barrel protein|nr:tRNA-U20-dihydrouridine synthase [Clostridiales bacterium]